MLNRICLLLGMLALFAPVWGQEDGPVKMTPEFPFTFPLTTSGTDVTVKFPVMINAATVIKPGMVLRTLYILKYQQVEGSADLVVAHKGDAQAAYSRPTAAPEKSKLPPEVAHEVEGYRRTIWEVPQNFVMAMAQYPTEIMHLIYCPTSDKRDQHDERFSFFDGLFVGLPDGKVTVLAVENDSKANSAGLKAGDEIVAVGGIPVRNDLMAFSDAYRAAKKAAKENEASSYSMSVRGSKGESRTAQIAMPATFKSNFLNGM